MLWFWQMEGRRWPLDGKSFNIAAKAWRRLAASAEERVEERLARYDRADAAFDRQVEEEQRVHREEQARQQRRRRIIEAAGARTRVRTAALQERSRQRDPNPRFAILHALRDIAHMAYWQRWDIGYPRLIPLDDGDEMMVQVIAQTGSSSRPEWADWWPSPQELISTSRHDPGHAKSWKLQQTVAVRLGWDGSWSGRYVNGKGRQAEADNSAYRWRLDTLKLAFAKVCLPPSRLPPLLAEPSIPDTLWDLDPEEMSEEQMQSLMQLDRAQEHNATISEYTQCYESFFRTDQIESESPAIAPGAHAWAPSVLRQMLCGERPAPTIIEGRWKCDVGVAASLSLALPPQSCRQFEPQEPLPMHIALIAETCRINKWDEWPPRSHRESELPPAPFVDELPTYFSGRIVPASCGYEDQSKRFPRSFHFKDRHVHDYSAVPNDGLRHPPKLLPAPPPAPRTVVRVHLDLKPFLRTRGSHCRSDCGEIVGCKPQSNFERKFNVAPVFKEYQIDRTVCECYGQPMSKPEADGLLLSTRAPKSFHLQLPPKAVPKCAIACCSCEDTHHCLPPESKYSPELMAVLRYANARRAELARQISKAKQLHMDDRAAWRKEHEKKLKRKQQNRETRARKRIKDEAAAQAILDARHGDGCTCGAHAPASLTREGQTPQDKIANELFDDTYAWSDCMSDSTE